MASKRPVSQLTGFTVHGNHETVADMLSVMMMFHHRRARAPVNTANAWTLPYHQGISMIWSTYGNFTCVLYYKDVAFRVYLTSNNEAATLCCMHTHINTTVNYKKLCKNVDKRYCSCHVSASRVYLLYISLRLSVHLRLYHCCYQLCRQFLRNTFNNFIQTWICKKHFERKLRQKVLDFIILNKVKSLSQ